jgi:hypothetical protein
MNTLLGVNNNIPNSIPGKAITITFSVLVMKATLVFSPLFDRGE